MLYLVATPIGNLADITCRAIETLKKCSLILCEDTRHSRKLTQHYGIATPLKSYHKFNEAKLESSLIAQLKKGQSIALISDAGTPGISDPGARLVRLCQELNLPVTSLPGPCAAITALTLSGLATEPFQFVGFLPKKKGELTKKLQELCRYPGTSIAYESPQRLKNVLALIKEISPTQPLAVARELTKLYEEVKLGTAEELLLEFGDVKGEIVLLIGAGGPKPPWQELSIEEHFQQKLPHLSKNEAIKAVAEERRIPKRQVYNLVMKM
jgi:16S rRNA (cytidine1402-2'-O)-methyltransferase